MNEKTFTYESLIAFLENWTTWNEDPHQYDLGGVSGLLAACVRNLKEHEAEIELDSWEDRFSQEEVDVLAGLVKRLQERGVLKA